MKWLLIILVIVIVLGGGYLVYAKYGKGTTTTASPSPISAVTSSPSATVSPSASASVPADWKTYTNDTYIYLIKYPGDWKVSSDKGTNSSAPKRVSWVDFGNSFSIEVLNDYTSIDEWVNDQQNSDLGKNLYTVKDIDLLGGLPAKQLSTTVEGGAVRTGLHYGKYVYVFHLIGESKPTSVYDQILSTLDFTADAR